MYIHTYLICHTIYKLDYQNVFYRSDINLRDSGKYKKLNDGLKNNGINKI